MGRFAVLLTVWVLLAAAPAVRAADAIAYPSPNDAVGGTTDITYADLLRLVVPDLEVRDAGFTGSRMVDLRHIDDAFGGLEPPESLATFQVAAFDVGGDERVALFFDLGVASESAEGFAILALFDVSAAPRLLDAANVAFDRFTFPLNPYRLDLGGGDLLLTASTHHNASQGYATVPLILVRDDRFELVDSVFLFDDSACAYHRIQRIEIGTGPGSPMADIVATATEATDPTGDDCDDATVPEPAERANRVTYRWAESERRYLPDSDAFERLAAENEQRF